MKKFSLKSVFIPVLAIAMALFLVTTASAMTPSLTVTSNGTGSLQVSVYGDANAPVILDYYSGNQLMGAGVIGYTNYSGYFSSTINSYQYNVPSGASAVVVVNGQQSSPGAWPSTYNNGGSCGYYNGYYTCNNGGYTNGQISLSQTSLNLYVGQSQSVTIYNNNSYYGYNQYYVTNNSNGVVSGTVNGNTITVYGQSAGSGSLSVCSNYGGCATLYVTVTGNYYNNGGSCGYYNGYYSCNNGGYTGSCGGCYTTCYPCNNYGYGTPISVSNNNVQVRVGSTASVTIYGGNNNYQYGNGYYGYNNYYVTSNNSNIAYATVNGNVLNIYGTNPGSTTITVYSANGGGQCTTIYVTVTQQYTYYPW